MHKVILPGFVDDPEQTILFGRRIAKHHVELPPLERCRVSAVVDANDKPF